MKVEPLPRSEDELTLHGLWEDLSAVLFRRKQVVATVAIAALFVVYVGQMFVGDIFEAQASLLVRMGRENIEVPLTVGKGEYFPTGVRKEEVNSYIALLTSRPLIESVVRSVGYERFRPELPKPETLFGWIKYSARTAIRWGRKQLNELQILLGLKRRLSDEEMAYLALSRSLKVDRFKDADVIDLRLRLPDAGLARDCLQALTDLYLIRHVEVMLPDQTALRLFEQEVRTSGDTLLSLREKLAQLKSEMGVTAVVEQKQQLLEMLRVAELERLETERENALAEGERQAVMQRRNPVEELQLSTKSVGPSATTLRIRQAVADLQLERTLALSKYRPDSDPVRKIESQIADLESAISVAKPEEDGSRTLARNPAQVYLEARAVEGEVRIQALAAVMATTVAQIESIRSELKRLDKAEADLQRLQMEINITESRLLSNTSRREEARGQETLSLWKVANVSRLASASFSERPVSPNRVLIVVMGAVGGLFAGITVALLMEWKTDVIYGPKDLDRIAPGLYLGTFTPPAAVAAGAGTRAQGNYR